MSWAALITALVGLVGQVMALLRDRQIRAEGVQAQVAQDQKETIRDVQKATDARAAVERDAALHPDRMHDDDGFRRD